MRDQPLPTPRKTGIWVALGLLSYALSLWGTDFLQLGLYSFEHILKHVLVYFYVARHFRRSHLPWYVASLAAAILAESAIGMLQYQGILPPGLILDKGAGSDRLETQYGVLGVEDVNRATGLSYDSHALGIYLAMLLPTALAFLFWEGIRPRLRMAAGVLLALGLAALVVGRLNNRRSENSLKPAARGSITSRSPSKTSSRLSRISRRRGSA